MDTTRLENLINDLFSLEVNTIIKQGMLATKMPNPAHALIDVAIDYSIALCRLGGEPGTSEGEASFRVFDDLRQGAARRARALQGLSEDKAIAKTQMPKPLSDGQVTYDDGSPQTVDQYARDVSAFLMFAAEPHLEDRKKTGFRVMVFLLLFGALVYMTKRRVWADVAH